MRKSRFGGLAHFLFFQRKVNEMDTGNQFLGTERVSKLMRQYAIPCIISLLVGALYNIVDQIFIANASYLGSYGNAANTVVFPLTVVALAIAVMVHLLCKFAQNGLLFYACIGAAAAENEAKYQDSAKDRRRTRESRAKIRTLLEKG